MKHFNFDIVPRKTGIYLFKDGDGKVLYVGKAKDLRARLKSYLHPESDSRQRIVYMMEEASDFEVFLTSNESEALLLENNLIKKKRPPYNVYFRDDKEYLCVRIHLSEEFPRFKLVRKVYRDGALYIGPYSSAKKIRSLLSLAGKLFPMRNCTDSAFKKRNLPCMQYQIKRCTAPCVGLIGQEEYKKSVKRAVKFMRGDFRGVRRELIKQMKDHSDSLKFEQAASIRDTLKTIDDISSSQSVVVGPVPDSDVFGIYREGNDGAVAVLFLRNCRVIDIRSFMLHAGTVPDDHLFASLLKEYYREGAYMPEEVVVPHEVDGALESKRIPGLGSEGPKIVSPRRGKRREMVHLASRNAEDYFMRRKKKELIYKELMEYMERTLRLRNRPVRVGCFDVSHHGGKHPVGSMVIFEWGSPVKGAYRRFRIREVEGIDDYAMIGEIVSRGVADVEEGGEHLDLIVIDGGKGHLQSGIRACGGASAPFDIISIAKEGRGKNISESDKVYLPGRKNPLTLKRGDPLLLFIMRVRDEAHRFALTFQRSAELKGKLVSLLSGFHGIGPGRVKKLLTTYGSLKGILERSPGEISELLRISPSRTVEFLEYLRKEFIHDKKYRLIRDDKSK